MEFGQKSRRGLEIIHLKWETNLQSTRGKSKEAGDVVLVPFFKSWHLDFVA